jgi:6-phosphofructokinase 1
MVEVMGRDCGDLALMSGFEQGKWLGLINRNENAHLIYTASFIASLFEAESAGRFDVRQAILGRLQEGGDRLPFGRIQATRLAANCIDFLCAEAARTRRAQRPLG